MRSVGSYVSKLMESIISCDVERKLFWARSQHWNLWKGFLPSYLSISYAAGINSLLARTCTIRKSKIHNQETENTQQNGEKERNWNCTIRKEKYTTKCRAKILENLRSRKYTIKMEREASTSTKKVRVLDNLIVSNMNDICSSWVRWNVRRQAQMCEFFLDTFWSQVVQK